MSHYKSYSYNEVKRMEFRFEDLIRPNTIEYTIHYMVDHKIDLSVFDSRYRNDSGGAPAYAPAILLKIILYAYSCGMISSRRIARSCRENLMFMALAAGRSRTLRRWPILSRAWPRRSRWCFWRCWANVKRRG